MGAGEQDVTSDLYPCGGEMWETSGPKAKEILLSQGLLMCSTESLHRREGCCACTGRGCITVCMTPCPLWWWCGIAVVVARQLDDEENVGKENVALF